MNDEQSKQLDTVSNIPSRSEKTAWNRKMDKMVSLVAKVNEVQDELMELQRKQMEAADKIEELRSVMVMECVHPKQYLVHKDTFIECKFCNRKISLPVNA